MTFDKPLVPPGPTDQARWALFTLGVPRIPQTALVIGGEVELAHALFTGGEDQMQYLGTPPDLRSADNGLLQPFLIPAVP